MYFKDFRENEKGFLLFAIPFTLDIDNSPAQLQLEPIDIQNKSDLKNAYRENDLLNFHICIYQQKNSQNYCIMQRRT